MVIPALPLSLRLRRPSRQQPPVDTHRTFALTLILDALTARFAAAVAAPIDSFAALAKSALFSLTTILTGCARLEAAASLGAATFRRGSLRNCCSRCSMGPAGSGDDCSPWKPPRYFLKATGDVESETGFRRSRSKIGGRAEENFAPGTRTKARPIFLDDKSAL